MWVPFAYAPGMKRVFMLTAATLAAVFTAAPAHASPPAHCTDTTRTNIPQGDPDYGPWLDKDNDGVACESS